MSENWAPIPEYPKYEVSDEGRVVNGLTGRVLRESCNPAGIVKVGLFMDGVQRARSVKVLVAQSFVDGCNDGFDTPVQLDGDQHNNRADNIVWRPRWFALKYTKQLHVNGVHHDRGPIYDDENGEVYETFFDAAITHGLLVEHIWRSVITKIPVFPTGQTFSFVR